MITPTEITAAVSAAVGALFPGETVYENLVPREFTRPCNLVELTGIALGEITPGGVELRYAYRVTDFVEVDERHNSQFAPLDLRTMRLVGLFAKGYLRVGDRAMKVRSCATEHNRDYTETAAVLALHYGREEFDPAAILPLMQELTLNTSLKEDTNL